MPNEIDQGPYRTKAICPDDKDTAEIILNAIDCLVEEMLTHVDNEDHRRRLKVGLAAMISTWERTLQAEIREDMMADFNVKLCELGMSIDVHGDIVDDCVGSKGN